MSKAIANDHTMTALRGHLFDTIEQLKDGSMETKTANSICQAARQLIDSAEVEIQYIRLTDVMASAPFLTDQRKRKK